jgi:N-acetylneuraminic acid mutarotase
MQSPMNTQFKRIPLKNILLFTGYISGILGVYSQDSSINFANRLSLERSWTKIAETPNFSPRSNHQIVSFKDGLWLIGGTFPDGKPAKDIWCSEDAINWKMVSDTLNFEGGTAIVFQDKIWLINANGKTNWSSPDGINWKKESSNIDWAEYGTSSAVFQNKIWLTGGADVYNTYLANGELNPDRRVEWKNEVWSSADGIYWKKENTDSCFTIRSHHSMAVYGDKLWILCGQSGPNKNDIWNSTDGRNWKLVSEAPFRARHVCETVVFENQLWIIGGFGFNDNMYPILLDDVWNTSDGKNWKQVTISSPFGPLMEHKAFVFNNMIWVVGGQCGKFPDQVARNDIWHLVP